MRRRHPARPASGRGARRGRADRKHDTANGGHRPEQSGPDAVEQAAHAYAQELPALLRKAIKRSARGKPSPLLRSMPRLIRESAAILEQLETKRNAKPRVVAGLEQFGKLSSIELEIMTDWLTTHRAVSAGHGSEIGQHGVSNIDALLGVRRDATDQLDFTGDTESPAAPAQQVEPPPPAARIPYTGPERRVRHIPSNVNLGNAERRRQRQPTGLPANSPAARKLRRELQTRTKLAD